ncbi:MAG TPA: TIGR03435 family protein [Bryobacteraceae bacterium]
MRKAVLLAPLLAGLAFGQGLSFEVASIKPAPPLDPQTILSGGKMHVGMQIDEARVDIGHGILFTLIMQAFDLKMHQVQGPEWMLKNPDGFDILATLPPGAQTSQVPEMLQNLLKDRFGLKYHMVKQEKDAYALVLGKQPLKLEQVVIEEAKPVDPSAPPPEPPKGAQVINIPGAGQATVTPNGGFVMNMRPQAAVKGIGNIRMTLDAPKPGTSPLDVKMTMEMEATLDAFAGQLSSLLDKPVVDMTELKGGYKFPLEMGLTDLMGVAQKLGGNMGMNLGAQGGGGGAGPATAASDPGGSSSLKDSVQKLGLRLEPRKLAIDVMVIDRIEKTPTEN